MRSIRFFHKIHKFNKLILKTQQKFKSGIHTIFIEGINKIASSSKECNQLIQ